MFQINQHRWGAGGYTQNAILEPVTGHQSCKIPLARTHTAGAENPMPGSVGCCWVASEHPDPGLLPRGGKKQPGLGSWRKRWKSSSFLCCCCSSFPRSNRRKQPS